MIMFIAMELLGVTIVALLMFKRAKQLGGGAAARMIAEEVSNKNPFFSLRGPATALHTASAEGAS